MFRRKVELLTVYKVALEAAQIMAGGEKIQLLEVEDLVIGRAIVFQDEKTGVETMATLSNVIRHAASPNASGSITADFTVSTHLSHDQTSLTKVASGKVNVVIGEASCKHVLPRRSPKPAHLIDIDADRFYSSLGKIGYGYTGPFRGISEMQRRLDFCTGLVRQPAPANTGTPLLVHPGLLDHAFQALFGSYSWPGDGRFWTLFLPTSIRKVSVDPSRCRGQNMNAQEVKLAFDAWLVDSPSREMRGDVSFSAINGADHEVVIQVEGASMVSLTESPASEDRSMFFETVWGVSTPDGDLAVGAERATEQEYKLAEACERVCHYYWLKLNETLTLYEREHCAEHQKHLLEAISHLLGREMDGKQSYIKQEWRHDNEQLISELIEE